MSWKCVLVGLALVLPGTLLIAEGRHPDQNEVPAPEKKLKHDRAQEVQNSEFVVNNNAPQPPPSTRTDKTPSNRNGQEINAQVVPAAQPLSQSAGQSSSSGNDNPGFLTNPATFIMVVSGCTVLAAIGIVGAGVCWYKYHKGAKAASVVEYPAYGVTGPTKDHLPSPGDRKLAKSAQMYHYQHQKQQMIAMEKANGNMKHDASDDESEEDNVEGDYTVYECPGLAPTGEMEVKNPLFRGDETPSSPVSEDRHQQQADN